MSNKITNKVERLKACIAELEGEVADTASKTTNKVPTFEDALLNPADFELSFNMHTGWGLRYINGELTTCIHYNKAEAIMLKMIANPTKAILRMVEKKPEADGPHWDLMKP